MFDAVQAVLNQERARELERAALEQAIDADVQKLRNLADKHMLKLPGDDQYYRFELAEAEIEYPKPKVVIQRFMNYLDLAGFIVPDVKCKNAYRKSKRTYIFRWRASDAAYKAAKLQMETKTKTPDSPHLAASNSGSSTLS